MRFGKRSGAAKFTPRVVDLMLPLLIYEQSKQALISFECMQFLSLLTELEIVSAIQTRAEEAKDIEFAI